MDRNVSIVIEVVLRQIPHCLLFSFRMLSTEQRSLSESLTLLVAPFMDVLAGARTRLYLSHGSVVGAVELLTSLLDQWLQGLGSEEPGVEVENARGTVGESSLQ